MGYVQCGSGRAQNAPRGAVDSRELRGFQALSNFIGRRGLAEPWSVISITGDQRASATDDSPCNQSLSPSRRSSTPRVYWRRRTDTLRHLSDKTTSSPLLAPPPPWPHALWSNHVTREEGGADCSSSWARHVGRRTFPHISMIEGDRRLLFVVNGARQPADIEESRLIPTPVLSNGPASDENSAPTLVSRCCP